MTLSEQTVLLTPENRSRSPIFLRISGSSKMGNGYCPCKGRFSVGSLLILSSLWFATASHAISLKTPIGDNMGANTNLFFMRMLFLIRLFSRFCLYRFCPRRIIVIIPDPIFDQSPLVATAYQDRAITAPAVKICPSTTFTAEPFLHGATPTKLSCHNVIMQNHNV